MEASYDEAMFFERNCSTCEYASLTSAVIDRMTGREIRTPPSCLSKEKGLTYEQRQKIVFGIGHTRQPGDCPRYKQRR